MKFNIPNQEETQANIATLVQEPDIIEVEAEEIPNDPIYNSELSDIVNPFGWEVEQQGIYNARGERKEGVQMIVRSDTQDVLNLCTEKYQPTTNMLFSAAVTALSKYTGFEVADIGEVQNGRKVVAFLKNPEPFRVGDFDYKNYIMLGNSHDSSSAFFIGSTTHMIRCSNQFTQTNQNLKAYHTGNNEDTVKQITSFFANFAQLNLQQQQYFNKFLMQSISGNEKNKLIRKLLEIPEQTKIADLTTQKQRSVQQLNDAIMRETNDIGRNVLGLFNGVTYWTTHEKKQKEKVFGNFHGAVNTANQTAFKYCKALI